jgi:hypothetical protein
MGHPEENNLVGTSGVPTRVAGVTDGRRLGDRLSQALIPFRHDDPHGTG